MILGTKSIQILMAFIVKDAQLYLSYRAVLVLNLFSVLFAVATYFFMGETLHGSLGAYGTRYFPFVILGMSVSTFLLAATGGLAANLSQEMRSGTLEAILATPPSPTAALLCMSAWNFVYAVAISLVYLIAAICLFNLQLQASGLLAAGVVLLFAFLCFYALGICAAAFVLRFKRGNPIQWLLGSLQVLLGGVYFPIEQLPPFVQKVAMLLPLVHAVEGTRQALLLGADLSQLGPTILLLVLLSVALLPLGLWLLKHNLKQIRLHGTFLQH